MKRLILLVLLLMPVYAQAADFTLDDIIGILPNFGSVVAEESTSFSSLFNLLSSSANSLEIEKTLEQTKNAIQTPDHVDYIQQYMFPPGSNDTASSSSVTDIATQIFGGKAKKKLTDCISAEFGAVWSRGRYGEEVRELQKFLNQNARTRIAVKGPGSPGKETEYYGALTVDAVKRFQTLFAKDILKPVGLSAATGLWGPSTIKKANEITTLCK